MAQCYSEAVTYRARINLLTPSVAVLWKVVASLAIACTSCFAQSNGEQLFLNNCAECHQQDGQGIAGIYPALADNELVTGSAVDVALMLVIGRGEMPPFQGALTANEMTAIINYVRNAWGNEGEQISTERIATLLENY